MKLLRKGEKAAGNFGAAVSASWSSLLSSTGLSAGFAAISAAASRPTRLCPIEIEQACRSGPLLAGSGSRRPRRYQPPPPRRAGSVNTRIAGQLIPAQWSKSASALP